MGKVVLVAACAFAVAWVERDPFFKSIGNLWIVSDALTEADVAVVLGGGLDVRPFAAADLYRKGLVRMVIISQVEDDRAVSIGAVTNHTELNRRILLKLGVPATAIETFGVANKSTHDEAIALRAWSEQNKAVSTFAIPTEIFSARRVRFIFRRELVGKNIEVLSLEPPLYTVNNWWKTELGLVTFQNEILKYAYYRIKY